MNKTISVQRMGGFKLPFLFLVVGVALSSFLNASLSITAFILLMSLAWALQVKDASQFAPSSEQIDSRSDHSDSIEIKSMLGAVQHDLNEEFQQSVDEIAQVRGLQATAIEGLVESFTGLEQQSRQQLDMVVTLIERISDQFKVPDRGSVNPTPSGGQGQVICL